MDITKVKMLQATLSWLNDTFVSAVGMKPLEDLPNGYRSNATACIIANALTINAPPKSGYWSVTNSEIELVYEEGSEHWDVPSHISDFISQFDAGDFPEYIKEYE